MEGTVDLLDELIISVEEGFPKDLRLEDYLENVGKAEKFAEKFLGRDFEFHTDGVCFYNVPPNTVMLVQMIGDKLIYWADASIMKQTITPKITYGTYIIKKMLSPDEQRRITDEFSPMGKNYFDDDTDF